MDEVLLRVHSRDLHEHLVQEVGECLETGLYTDLIIRCKGGHAIHAHKLVLSAASPYLKWLLENNEWEEVQSLELPDAQQSHVSLLLEVVYNGVVEATMPDLRGLIILAHQLYISIPISEELMQGLDLTLPLIPAFATKCGSLPRLKQRPPPPLLQNNNIMYKPPALKQPPTSPNYYERSLMDASTAAALLSANQNVEHVCPICNSRYNNIGNFKQHMRLHDNDQLRDQRNQMLSEMVATGFNPGTSLYTCHVCNSTYNHSGNFKQHLLKHERESGSISALLVAQAQVTTNNHLADVLQSAITDRVDHGDNDSAKMQYQCEQCGRGFKHPGNYKQHLASHLKTTTSNSPMGALVSNSLRKINASFGMAESGNSKNPESKLKTSLKDQQVNSRIKSEGDNSKIFRCRECPERFDTEAGLKRHRMSNHESSNPVDPLEVDPAREEDDANGYVDWPIAFKRKPGRPPKIALMADSRPSLIPGQGGGPAFKCRICQKIFFKMSKLTAHMKIHSAPEDHYRYPCDICGKKFTRPQHVNRHKLLHTGERPFKCWLCQKAFAREDKCKYHMKNECDLRGHVNPDEVDPLGGHQTDNEEEAMMELEPHVILAD